MTSSCLLLRGIKETNFTTNWDLREPVDIRESFSCIPCVLASSFNYISEQSFRGCLEQVKARLQTKFGEFLSRLRLGLGQ